MTETKAKSASKESTRREEIAPFDRRQQIIFEAARIFALKGFAGTSMRDIANATGILVGSLYHHFASKEEMFVAVHAAGMETLISSVKGAIEGIEEPWQRLEAAAGTHCAALLESGDLMIMVVPSFEAGIDTFRDELIRQRDEYEAIIIELVANLDLPADVDRRMFRLHLLGALNWTQTWYRPGFGMTPAQIGAQLVKMLRHGGAITPLPASSP